ncbi:hypothetical protein [Aquirufa antheringensis]|uniref:hypothetical protein n=1 Tax=Aquirufa antheringensis TaxID=2516559 RepID=UPI00208DFAF9|nr:hypothetical protein [Aquirufa antheringensis]USQ03360.1 hypothetical protein G9X63_04310 [Aquirufa antheringensis]
MEENNQISLKVLLSREEIYLIDIFKVIKNVITNNIKWILIISSLVLIGTTVKYYLSPIEFESKSVVYIESKSTNASANMVKDLLTGSKTESSDNSISPDNYKSIVSSQVFLNDLIEIKFSKDYNSKDSINLLNFFKTNPDKEFFQSISSFFNSTSDKKIVGEKLLNKKLENETILKTINRNIVFSNQIPPIVQFSDDRLAAFSKITKRIRIEIKDKTLTVFVKMPTPYLSAVVGKLVLERLLLYTSSMQMYKHNVNIDYLERRLSEAELKYKNAQRRFAGYKDNSLGVIFESAQTNNQILSNDMTVAFNLLNQFAVQLEQAKIDQKKETPYFSILEPIAIPSEPIEPSKTSFILKSLALLLALNFLFIVFKLFKN